MLKKILAILLSVITVFSAVILLNDSLPYVVAADNSSEFGNLPGVLLNGGYSADCGDSIVYSDSNDCGRLYIRNSDSDEVTKLSDNNASYINVFGKTVYYISETDDGFRIYKQKIGKSAKELYSSVNRISNLFVSSDEMYFLEDAKVNCYDFSSKELFSVFENEEMYAFVPKTNGDIFWLKKKADVERPAVYPKQFEGTEEYQIDFDCFLYDVSEGESSETNYLNVINSGSISTNSNPDSLKTLKLSAVINGKKIPTEEFPNNTFFTDNGKGCTDHRTDVCGHETEDKCNCKAFYNGTPLYAVQCYGYARFLYLYVFGYVGLPGSKKNYNLGSLSEGNVTLEAFKDLFEEAKPGAQMRVTYIKSDGVTISNHSLIILDWNETGFSACEGNLDAKCGTFVKRRSFESYVPTLISVDFFHMPKTYHEEDVSTTVESSTSSESTTSTVSETETTTVTETESTTREGGIMTRIARWFIKLINDTVSFFKDIIDDIFY